MKPENLVLKFQNQKKVNNMKSQDQKKEVKKPPQKPMPKGK